MCVNISRRSLFSVSAILAMIVSVFIEASSSVRAEQIVVVFSGHTESLNCLGGHRGAKSASGIYEFQFNDAVVNLFGAKSCSGIRYIALPASLNIPLQSRGQLAERLGASAVIEIHHDSVQPHIYAKLVSANPTNSMLEFYRGFSIHVFPSEESLRLARDIESRLIEGNFLFSTYHQEDVHGERMKLALNARATYERTQLNLLRNSSMPTVIIECACIANPKEEETLKDKNRLERIVQEIHKGIQDYFGSVDKFRLSK